MMYKEEISKQLILNYLKNNKYDILSSAKSLVGDIGFFVQKKSFSDMFGFSNPITFVDIKTYYRKIKNQKVSDKKRQEIQRYTERWFEENKLPKDHPCQIDLIHINIINKEKQINHFKNI